ncbi:MAG TPA: ADOP family duplicated permease [Rhodanobacteraceae bacterium]
MILRELRQAWRRLCKRPGYALLSVAVLGVGLGAVLFVFSLVNTLVLQPLPFPQASRLVAVGEPNSSGIDHIDSDQYLKLRGKLHSVDLLGAYAAVGVSIDSGHGATYCKGSRLTASMMQLLGVEPILGRGFTPADDVPGAPRVILLSDALWQHQFGADPHIIGRSVKVNGAFARVIGVAPATFAFPTFMQAWLPLRVQVGQHRDIHAIGRLAPGATMGQARAELHAWVGRLARALMPGQMAMHLAIGPMASAFVPRQINQWVWLMFGATLLVLLLACINVANLQLVQTLQRRHEMALRSALGSSRARLVMGALAESLLLSAGALAVAFPLAKMGIDWIVTTWAANNPGGALSFVHYGVGGWVAVFGVAVAVLCTGLAGGIPAWRASRVDLQDALRDGSKGSSGGFARIAKTLVVAEVALTVVLLVGAGTFVRGLDALLAQPAVGATHAPQVLTADVVLPAVVYKNDAHRIRFFHSVIARLRWNPAVVDATATNTIPSAMLGSHEDVSLPGRPEPLHGWPRVQMGIVGPHFLNTFGVHLVEGRFFDARDSASSERVAVIDAKMANAFWPHQDPLGRKFVMYPGNPWAQTLTVVGVVQALQLDGMLQKSLPGVLRPLAQAGGLNKMASIGLAVRTHADAMAFAHALTNAVHAVDPQAAVYAMRSQSRDMARSRNGLSILTEVFTTLGLIALLLAAAGLYGVLAFAVAQRTREIGIRRAIGAGGAAIVGTVGRTLAWQLGLGLLIGLALAVPWSNLLANPDMRTQAHDPAVFVVVGLLVVGVSMLAALAPLMRALHVDPSEALRYE